MIEAAFNVLYIIVSIVFIVVMILFGLSLLKRLKEIKYEIIRLQIFTASSSELDLFASRLLPSEINCPNCSESLVFNIEEQVRAGSQCPSCDHIISVDENGSVVSWPNPEPVDPFEGHG